MLQKPPRGGHRTACGLRPLNACSKRQPASDPSTNRNLSSSNIRPPYASPARRSTDAIVTRTWSRCPRLRADQPPIVVGKQIANCVCICTHWSTARWRARSPGTGSPHKRQGRSARAIEPAQLGAFARFAEAEAMIIVQEFTVVETAGLAKLSGDRRPTC
ncbi:hypothetical protein MES5069_320007 [Mesorhizobium escarrei]|uniref:Uncharacterized protein n=1 Tax=Mesorhizobium escarrei TaxID=666018 RepID=A0ABM9E0N0_9HYPH|nr:hypothetical protein MES5069_320007 [Mesorhizobium escarrei]